MIFHIEQLFDGVAKLGTDTNTVFLSGQYQSIQAAIRYGLKHYKQGKYRISQYSDSINPTQNSFYSGNPQKQIVHTVLKTS